MVAALGLALGCGTATNNGPIGTDAGGDAADTGPVDAGRTLAEWQLQAANTLGNEMSEGLRAMQTYPASNTPAFMTALAAWNAAVERERDNYRTDASVPDQRANAVAIRVNERFPAYCAMRAAVPDAVLDVVPRIPCPPPAPAAWWELYP